MSLHIGIGFSQELNAELAAKEAAIRALAPLGHHKPDLVLLTSTVHYDPHQTLPVIQNLVGNTRLIGCSSTGILLSDAIKTRGIAVLAIQSSDLRFGVGSVNSIHAQDPVQAGTILAKSCLADFGQHGRQIFMFFVDGFLQDNSSLLKGVQDILGNVFPIIGAGSSDDFRFDHSFQIFQNKVLSRSAVGLILGGQLSVGVGGRHGWRPLGKPRFITSVQDNIIQTIDNQKASHIYEEYLDKEAEHLKTSQLGRMSILYPLGIYVEGSREYLLRNAVDIQQDGSIVCQGAVPEGAEVHVMIGNKESCKQAAMEAAQDARNNLLGKDAQLVLVFESMARLKLLGRAAFEEVSCIKRIFGPTTPIFGMYTYGEICPFELIEHSIKPHLQNESIVVLAIA